MIVVENDIGFVFSDDELLAYMEHKAKGGNRGADAFGCEVSEVLGDITGMTAEIAGLLAQALKERPPAGSHPLANIVAKIANISARQNGELLEEQAA